MNVIVLANGDISKQTTTINDRQIIAMFSICIHANTKVETVFSEKIPESAFMVYVEIDNYLNIRIYSKYFDYYLQINTEIYIPKVLVGLLDSCKMQRKIERLIHDSIFKKHQMIALFDRTLFEEYYLLQIYC